MTTIPFQSVIGPLAAALGLSVGVERILEFFKNFLEPRLGAELTRKVTPGEALQKRAEQLQRTLDAAEDGQTKAWDEQVPTAIALVRPATDPDDGSVFRALILQLLGFAVGILLARIFRVQMFDALLGNGAIGARISAPLDYVLTGLFIGGGSAPAHLLVRFITERKVSLPESAPERAAPPAPAPQAALVTSAAAPPRAAASPAIVLAPPDAAAEEWPDLRYEGGVDRDLLENVHRRSGDPNLVVFHHTAMSMRSTFQDVVNVIKSRTDAKGRPWLTGYHCVILGDGSIHPFCRWDRYGTHAAGFNDRSLGLAFNGNFENDPKVPCSNPTGRYGPLRPTDAQLRSGAKVVALWSFLYPEISIDFDRKILPHTKIPNANKPCPGSQFAYDEFRKLVEHYHERWKHSPYIQDRIGAFKLKSCLYVKR